MPINKPGEMTSMEDNQLPILNGIINEICTKAMSVKYSSVVPTATTVAEGEIVIYDNDAGTKRLYVVTNKKNLGYVNLT